MQSEETTRAMFHDYLDSLDYRSIGTFAQIARERDSNPRGIVTAIETKMMTYPAHKRFLLLYLIDAIVKIKEIRPVYTPLFSANITDMFVAGYSTVPDAQTQSKLKTMLGIWRDKGIFPSAIVDDIDSRIHPSSSSLHRPHQHQPYPHPYHQEQHHQHQLQHQQQYQQMLQPIPQPIHLPPPVVPHPPPASEYDAYYFPQQPPVGLPFQQQFYHPPPPGQPQQLHLHQHPHPQQHPHQQPIYSAIPPVVEARDFPRDPRAEYSKVGAPPATARSNSPSSIGNGGVNVALLQQLLQSGNLASLLNPSGDAHSASHSPREQSQFVNPMDGIAPIQLSLDSLKTFNPDIVETIYSRRPLLCSQCAMRYPAVKKPDMEEHMDWHFRMNKKEKDRAKTARCRKWYLSESDWVTYKEMEEADEKVPSFFEQTLGVSTTTPASGGTGNGSGESAPGTRTAVLPDDPDGGVCRICRERLDRFWDEDSESWLYQDAVREGGQLYHARCYEDAKKSNSLPTPSSPSRLPDTVHPLAGSVDLRLKRRLSDEQPDAESRKRTEYE